jgi:hypothetical protein
MAKLTKEKLDQLAQIRSNQQPLLIEPYAYGSKTTAHASKYDKDQWRKWAQETGFKPKSRTVAGQNKEFQLYLLQDDKFKNKVKAIHEELGMPYAGKPDDAFLGERWDKIMEKLTEKKPAAKIAETPKLAEEKPKTDVRTPVIVSHGDPENERAFPPIAPAWWLQDEMAAVNAGLNYAGIKPYYPHEPKVDYQEARPTFLSPERQLAENQSQMRQQLDMLSRFKGPQAFNARANEISGKGFANAANTIADVHNRNVGIANQFEQFNTGIRNQETRENAAHTTSLWDKYTATRENFNNAKREAGDAMFNVAKQAVTNRANTYNMNQINPQWAVNPGQGGQMYFHDPRQLKPGQKQAPIGDAYKQKLADPAFTNLASSEDGRKILWNITQKEYGMPTDDFENYGKSRNIANQQVPGPTGYNQLG